MIGTARRVSEADLGLVPVPDRARGVDLPEIAIADGRLVEIAIVVFRPEIGHDRGVIGREVVAEVALALIRHGKGRGPLLLGDATRPLPPPRRRRPARGRDDDEGRVLLDRHRLDPDHLHSTADRDQEAAAAAEEVIADRHREGRDRRPEVRNRQILYLHQILRSPCRRHRRLQRRLQEIPYPL